jgi:hypothetical protein
MAIPTPTTNPNSFAAPITFQLYTDKSSLLKKNSRYVQGGTTDIIGTNTTGNILGFWDEREDVPINQVDDIQFVLTSDYNLRPDKIASDYYGRTDVTWEILNYNQIIDVNEEFITGAMIRIPSAIRLFGQILTIQIPSNAYTTVPNQ